jgi:ABC-type polysaccharide transport system permease subunit
MKKLLSLELLVAASIILAILTASPISQAQERAPQSVPAIPEFPALIIIVCLIVLALAGMLMLKRKTSWKISHPIKVTR